MRWFQSFLLFFSLLRGAGMFFAAAPPPASGAPAAARDPSPPILQEIAGLAELYPNEGRPGEELVLNLEGFGFLESGEFFGAAIGGLDVAVLDFIFESDNFGQVRILIPEDLPVGEQPITFFFEGAVLEAPFLVLEPAGPGGPEPTEAPGPADGPVCSPTCVLIVIVVCILIVSVVRAVGSTGRTTPGTDLPGTDAPAPDDPGTEGPDEREPDEDEPPDLPMDIGFTSEVDAGRPGIRPAGRPIAPDLDVEMDTALETTGLRIQPDGPIVDEGGVTLEEGDGI